MPLVKWLETWFRVGLRVKPEDTENMRSSDTATHLTRELKDFIYVFLPMAGLSMLLNLWIHTLNKEPAKCKQLS